MAKKEFSYEFDPVKEQKGNEQAQSVIWSTKSLNMAVDAITKGLPLKVNPFIGPNTKLLKPELVFKRTEEEIEDYIHCMQDICHFAEKCHVMTPEGLRKIKLRDYQIKYLKHLENNRFSIYLACRQCGKCNLLIINVLVKLPKNLTIFNKLINKYDYIDLNDYIVIYIPLFELFNIYMKQTMVWKIRYNIYKLIYKLEKWQNKNQNMKIQDMLNIIKSKIQNGQMKSV